MSENLSAAAEALGTPEAIIQRSAAARAKADGVAVEEVLAAWAGGTSAPAAASPPEPVAPAPEEAVAALRALESSGRRVGASFCVNKPSCWSPMVKKDATETSG